MPWVDATILHPMHVCLAFSSLTTRTTQQTFLVVCFANMGTKLASHMTGYQPSTPQEPISLM